MLTLPCAATSPDQGCLWGRTAGKCNPHTAASLAYTPETRHIHVYAYWTGDDPISSEKPRSRSDLLSKPGEKRVDLAPQFPGQPGLWREHLKPHYY